MQTHALTPWNRSLKFFVAKFTEDSFEALRDYTHLKPLISKQLMSSAL